MTETLAEIYRLDAERHAYFENRQFRGLWFSRRGGDRYWTVTYLNGDGEFEETDECPDWRQAVDAARLITETEERRGGFDAGYDAGASDEADQCVQWLRRHDFDSSADALEQRFLGRVKKEG